MKPLLVQAHNKQLLLSYNVAADVPDALLGDAGRLRQVFVNLVGNGIKFTQRGEVTVRVTAQSCTDHDITLHISVRDTGIGIDLSQQDTIFGAFTQADTSITRQYGGTGLGLAICRQLVEMMHGQMWLESRCGRGSTFHLTARFGRQSTSPPDAPTTTPATPQAPHTSHAPTTSSLRILLAEDNIVNQKIAVALLTRREHSVTPVTNGKEALAALAAEVFDLVLMDVQMPEMGGFQAVSQLREQERNTGEHIPVIAMTAHAMQGDRERCLAAGMDGYLAKPFKAHELFHTIERIMASQTRHNTIRFIDPPAVDPPAIAPPDAAASHEQESDSDTALVIFDHDSVLEQLGHDHALLAELASRLLSEMPGWLGNIRQAIIANDAATIIHAAHTLKGALGGLGAQAGMASAAKLEQAGLSEDLASISASYQHLEKTIAQLAPVLYPLTRQHNDTSDASPPAS